MAKFWVLLLLATIFQKIACSRENAFVPMQSRSSHIDSSEFIDDNRMGTKSIDTLRKVQKQQKNGQQLFQKYERRKLPGNFNDNIETIFYVGPEKGLTLFNTTLKSPISETDGTQAEESFTDVPQRPTEAQPLAKPVNKDFVFPDQLFIESEPKCEESVREGKPFCTKVRNYPPLKQLETILKNEFSKFEVFFNEDLPQPLNVTQRMNHEPDEEYLCASIEKVIYPEAAMTKDSNWLLIVNNHENYKQGVRIEECLNEGEMCHVVQFPNHYKATCKQSFIYRSLVAITPNGTITKDHFKMPSCCKCVLRQVH